LIRKFRILSQAFVATGGFGLKVVGFLVTTAVEGDGDVPYVIGFLVGFGFGRAGVVLSHMVGRGFVMKFGSVVICHGVEDQVATRKGKLSQVVTETRNSKTHKLRHSPKRSIHLNCR
jgi:hypothetical protein